MFTGSILHVFKLWQQIMILFAMKSISVFSTTLNNPKSLPMTSQSLIIYPDEGFYYSPSVEPSSSPSIPSSTPSLGPTVPTHIPSSQPLSNSPSWKPTSSPSQIPTSMPSISPSKRPTTSPIAFPSKSPSKLPSKKPSPQPTISPSFAPSSTRPATVIANPTIASLAPTLAPISHQSSHPTAAHSSAPTPTFPSHYPTTQPTIHPIIHDDDIFKSPTTTRPTTTASNSPSTPTRNPSSKPSTHAPLSYAPSTLSPSKTGFHRFNVCGQSYLVDGSLPVDTGHLSMSLNVTNLNAGIHNLISPVSQLVFELAVACSVPQSIIQLFSSAPSIAITNMVQSASTNINRELSQSASYVHVSFNIIFSVYILESQQSASSNHQYLFGVGNTIGVHLLSAINNGTVTNNLQYVCSRTINCTISSAATIVKNSGSASTTTVSTDVTTSGNSSNNSSQLDSTLILAIIIPVLLCFLLFVLLCQYYVNRNNSNSSPPSDSYTNPDLSSGGNKIQDVNSNITDRGSFLQRQQSTRQRRVPSVSLGTSDLNSNYSLAIDPMEGQILVPGSTHTVVESGASIDYDPNTNNNYNRHSKSRRDPLLTFGTSDVAFQPSISSSALGRNPTLSNTINGVNPFAQYNEARRLSIGHTGDRDSHMKFSLGGQ